MTQARGEESSDRQQSGQSSVAEGMAGLGEDTKQHIRDGLAAMTQTPGFRSRATQRLMIAEVAKTLSDEYGGDERVLCVEGPTGTGKSLGYLLPAIPVAQKRDKTLVIASATVALQEQLVEKDLPDLQNSTGMDFSFALAKGRRRYVCDRNLERLAGINHDQKNLDLGDNEYLRADWGIKPRQGEVEHVQRLWQARENGQFGGDLDEWDTFIRAELYEQLTTDHNGCTGKACPFNARCPFFTARRQLHDKDVIVANHALVMADLMLGGGVVLPEPAECIYIFDEGHHLPNVAISQGAAQTRLTGPKSWLNDLAGLPLKGYRAVAANGEEAQAIQAIAPELESQIPQLTDSLDDLQRFLSEAHPAMQTPSANETDNRNRGKRPQRGSSYADPNWRFPMGNGPGDLRALFEQAHAACEGVYAHVLKLGSKVRKAVDKEPDNRSLGMVQSSVQWSTSRVEQMVTALGHMAAAEGDASQPPIARWIECIDDGRDFACCASPTSAAHLLRDILWKECDGAVVTSGTLTSLGRFERYFEQTGLGAAYDTQSLHLASPFDYHNNARLDIPRLKASAKQHEAHTREIIQRIDDGLIDSNAGTLMLFASYRQMNAVSRGIAAPLASRILTQGSAPRHELMATHRSRIDAGQGSVLFGVASFSEGIDLPGDYCSHVIVAKLPFSVPDSPVDATYAEWLESQDRNPFMEMSVPEASFRLVQAAGRLLRTESDTGHVTVLDRRLADMPYGRMMMQALPPFQRNIES